MTSITAAVLILLAGCAGPALAQAPVQGGPRPADRTQLAACLGESPRAPSSCIGVVAVACVRTTATAQSAAEPGCARREEAVWRERMSQGLATLARSLDGGRRSQLASLQVAWEGFMAQKCAFYAALQTEASQPGRQAGCELREVAGRVIELARALPQPPARRLQQPPQIIR